MNQSSRIIGVVSMALGSLGLAQSVNFIKINPRGTYLRDSRWAPMPSMFSFEPGKPTPLPIGSPSGMRLHLRTVGWFNRSFDNPAAHNVSNQAVAVFSSDGLVDSDWSNQFRVFEAIEAGDDFQTLPTWVGNHPTDIAQDFGVSAAWTTVDIPVGATCLLLTSFDNDFWNNTDDFSMVGADPRGFGLEYEIITSSVPEPGTVLILGVPLVSCLCRRRKARS